MLPSFTNPDLLEKALTHRSAVGISSLGSSSSNERLEFLGDAVLELATTEFLFHKYPEAAEGELTAFRSSLVNTQMLALVAEEIELGAQLHMSSGEEASGGRTNANLLADSFEAIVGALFLDQGYQFVSQYLQEVLFPKIDQIVSEKLYKDAKSLLQEYIQSRKQPPPTYEVLKEEGPDHDKNFTIEVLVDGKPLAKGKGKSKQLAQQAAAQAALDSLSP